MPDTQTYPEEHAVADDRSLGSLIKEIRDESIELFQQEVDLARTEMTEKVSKFSQHVYAIAAGALVAFAGLIVFIMAIAQLTTLLLLYAGMGIHAEWIGPLIVGLAVLAIGGSIFATAKQKMETQSLVPNKTAQSMKDNEQWLKDKIT